MNERFGRYTGFFKKHVVWFVLVLSVTISICATAYYFQRNDILAYPDSRSHLDIARRIVDSKTPGIQQIGTVWLPLPHLLMLPFITNNTLWQTGLAGSIVSMISYVIASLLLYKITKLLSGSSMASVVASLLFMVNPNILYMQSTPMTELPLIATMLFGSYFFIKWLYTKKVSNLIVSAFGIMLSSLVRYEGWLVLVVCAAIIIFDRIIIAKEKKIGEGLVILFATLGAFGVALWVLWNWIIFGDPLYFLDGSYSAKAQQAQLFATGHLPTEHNPILSFTTILRTIDLNVGIVILTLTVIATLVVFLRRYTDKRVIYATLILIAPVVLDFITLVMGITAIYTTVPNTFNIRYGVMVVPFTSVIIPLASQSLRIRSIGIAIIGGISIVAMCIAQPATIRYDTTIGNVSGQSIYYVNAIKSHYVNGNILASTYVFDPVIFQVGLPLRTYIDEGTYQIWDAALLNPVRYANYVMMNDNVGSSDPVYIDYRNHPSRFSNYHTVYDSGGNRLLILK